MRGCRRVAPSDNKQVAPAPRYARLRGTPARDIAGLGSMLDQIEERSVVGRAEAPASQL